MDYLGLVLCCFVSAANVADVKAAPAVLVPPLEKYPRIEKVLTDQAYRAPNERAHALVIEGRNYVVDYFAR